MDSLLSTALEAAEAAAVVHLRHFGGVTVEEARRKAKSDFVTKVDLEAQEAALAVILGRFPDHRVLAEEETPSPGAGHQEDGASDGPRSPASALTHVDDRAWPSDGTPLWIVDPLDGTTNYLHRHPMFGASVGVGASGTLEAGAVVAARTGERWWARRGHGAFKNGRTITVSGLRTMKNAMVGTGFPFKEPAILPRYLEQLGRVLPASGGVRRGGSAALDLCYLAEGILDAFWEEDYLSPWDVAAGLVILREAGGSATRLDGSAIDLADGSVLAANSPDVLKGLRRMVLGG